LAERNEFKAAESLLNSIGDNPSFDIGEFIDRLSVAEDWGKLIVAHIYLDHIVTEVLNTHLDHPASYFNGYRSFAEKLSLCQAMGYFRDEFGNVLKAVNNSRNRFAHKLVFHVSDEEKRNLFRTLTTERAISEVTRPGGFEEFLFTVVMFAEISRSAEERQAELSKEHKFVSEKILELLIANKDLLGDKI